MTTVIIEGVVESDFEGFFIKKSGIHWRSPKFYGLRNQKLRVTGVIETWSVDTTKLSYELHVYLSNVDITRLETPAPKVEE